MSPRVLPALALPPFLIAVNLTPPEPRVTDPPVVMDSIAPTVTIDPGTQTFYYDTVSVHIEWCDDSTLDSDTRYIEFNGQDVTSEFSFEWLSATQDCTSRAESEGEVTLSVGQDTLYAEICDAWQEPLGPQPMAPGMNPCGTSNWGKKTVYYTYDDTPPPVVSTQPHNGDMRSPALCDACMDLTFTYSTPPYYTLDTPRSLTLFYSSFQAAPKGVVMVDVWNPPENDNPPDTVSLALKRPNGTWQGLTTGTDEIRYAFPADSASGVKTRLTAQFNLYSASWSAKGYTAVVRSYWNSGESEETTAPVRVLIQNERESFVGTGWTIAGLQTLVPKGDTLLVLQDGAGTIIAFEEVASDTFKAPRGDFTTIVDEGSGAYERIWRDSTRAQFSTQADGVIRVDSVWDRFGVSTVYHYSDTDGRLDSIVDPMGETIELTYSSSWDGLWKIDTGGRVTEITGDTATDEILSIEDPDGVSQSFTYSGAHRMRSWTDREGQTTDYWYASTGQLWKEKLPQVTLYDESSARPLTKFRGHLKRAMPNGGSPDEEQPIVYPDSLYGTVVGSYADTAFTWYNALGQATKTIDPEKRETVATYTADGLPTSITTPSGQEHIRSWSADGLLLKDSIEGLRGINYLHEPKYGLVDTVMQRDTLLSVNVYTSDGRLDEVELGGSTWDHRPDSIGRDTAVIDPKNHYMQYEYDSTTGNLEKTIRDKDPSLTTTRTFDTYGRLDSLHTASDGSWHYEYDDLNRVTDVHDPENANPTETRYGPIYPDTVIDPAGGEYVFKRNALGWVTERYGPASSTLADAFGYDSAGRVVEWTNRNGDLISYEYDLIGRQTKVTAPGDTLEFGYGSDDEYMWAENTWSSDTIWYTPAGWTDSTMSDRGSESYTVDYEYDHWSGRPTAIHDRYNSRTLDFGYNGQQQLDTLRARGLETYVGSRDDDLLDTLWTYPAELERIQSRNTAHQRGHLLWRDAGTGDTILLRNLGFDTAGRVQTVEFVEDSVHQFEYDELGRVTLRETHEKSVWCGGWDPVFGEQCEEVDDLVSADTFTYDAVGNRTDHNAQIDPGSRLRSIEVGGTVTYDYDSAGYVTRRDRLAYDETSFLHWSALGQLDSVHISRALSDDSVRYRYDALGRRIWKQSGSDTVEYVWASGHVLFTIADGEVTEYAYYPGADRLHSMFRSDTFYYYFTDHLGSVIAIADSQGTLQNRYEYDTWGYIQNPTENVGNRFGFTGREYDSETGFYYFRARYYDPATGRFISEDPIGLAGGLNPYAYAGNSPLSARDPSGLQGDLDEEEPDEGCPDGIYPGALCYVDGLEVVVFNFPGPFAGGALTLGGVGRRPGGFLWLTGSGGTTNPTQEQQRTIDYTPQDACPARPLTIDQQFDHQFEESREDGAERGGSGVLVHALPTAMYVLRRTMRHATQRRGIIPFDPHASFYWHTHPGLHPGSVQAPSTRDSVLAVRYNADHWVIARDSLYVIAPNGSAVGCGR